MGYSPMEEGDGGRVGRGRAGAGHGAGRHGAGGAGRAGGLRRSVIHGGWERGSPVGHRLHVSHGQVWVELTSLSQVGGRGHVCHVMPVCLTRRPCCKHL